MAKCLVTGGAGFIGAHVARMLVERGHAVVVLDDLSGGFVRNVPSEARFVEGSIVDDTLIARLFGQERFDYVYHLAAYAAEGLSHFIKRFNYTNNVTGSVTLINAAVNHDVGCFVFTSSIAVYGPGQLPMVESLRPEPEDSYGIAKFTVEQELEVTKRMFDLDYVVFRPHNVYGELQNIGDRYRNVLGIFMNQILSGEPLSIFGDGAQTRAFSYIQDITPAIVDAPVTNGARCEIFNVGADIPYSINDLARTVKDAMGAPDHPVHHLPARDEVMHAFSDHSKAQRVFGRNATTELDEGVRRMAEWARSHGARNPSRFGGIEIERNLPPSWLEETSDEPAVAKEAEPDVSATMSDREPATRERDRNR
jgi:UDP-glucose 4-epimerase